MQGHSTPHALPRARFLVGRAVLAAIATIFYGTIVYFLCLRDQPLLLQGVVFTIIFDGFFLLLIAPSLSRSWRPALLFGLRPERPFLRQYTLFVFPLVAVAIASMFLLYFPLSYVLPRFVEWQLSSQPRMIVGTSVLANLLCFSYIVLLGPVFEEFVFRGLLLTRWSLKWNLRRAIFLSSALFGLGHADLIGAFFFGYAMCVLCIETKSLFVPMSIHIANNGIAWILGSVDLLITGSDARPTLVEWQSYWWLGLLATVIVAPWVVTFIKRHIPADSWRVPYLALQENDEEEEISIRQFDRQVA